MDNMDDNSGGFLLNGQLLSPPPSSAASATAQVTLPQVRRLPLKAGSNKEAELLRYLDEKILEVQRRVAKRGTTLSALEQRQGIAPGYKSLHTVAHDLERVIDMLWMSATPRIQIPFLLTVALLVADYIPEFPPAAKVTITLLDKLDFVFASLLQGRNVETGELLPGFENGRSVSITEKVRIKSLVEQTRMRVIRVLGREFETTSSSAAGDTEVHSTDDVLVFSATSDGETVTGDEEDFDAVMDQHEIELSKIYDRTMLELGGVLGGTPIGIITDD